MKIGIVGAGYVGLVTAAVVGSAGHALVICETDPSRRDALIRRTVPVAEPGLQAMWDTLPPYEVVEHARDLTECDAVVVCVQTPLRPGGGIDCTHVELALGQLTPAKGPIVVRSTVPPGTCAALQRAFPQLTLAHVPEFLVEGRAVHDALHPTRVVLGTEHDALRPLLRELFVATCPVEVRHFDVDLTTAELAKVGANVALASRVALINALTRQALHHGTDPRILRDLLGSDPRIGADYLQPSLGFGGSCLPKDVAGLLHNSVEAGLPSPYLEGLQADNSAHLGWIVSWIETHAPPAPRVAVWGLSFKTGVADTRGSRVKPLLDGLLAMGANVRTHDPRVSLPVEWARPGLSHCISSLQAVENADVLVVATAEPDWAEPPLQALTERMRGRWIVDGSFTWDPAALRDAGWIPLGRQTP